jgi:hypothetical protein
MTMVAKKFIMFISWHSCRPSLVALCRVGGALPATAPAAPAIASHSINRNEPSIVFYWRKIDVLARLARISPENSSELNAPLYTIPFKTAWVSSVFQISTLGTDKS